MTSNQISYATQQEQKRHNLATEEQENENLRIREKQVDNENWYNQTMAAITSEYNRTYLALQKAQGDEKLDLQRDLNDIEDRKQRVEAEFKRESIINAQSANALRDAELQETKSYHETLKSLGYNENAIKWYEAMVHNKAAEYQRYFNENQVRIQDYNALSGRMRIQNDWQLGLLNVENQQVANEIRNEELQERKKLWDVQKATQITDQVFTGLNTIKGFIPGINLLSNLGGK